MKRLERLVPNAVYRIVSFDEGSLVAKRLTQMGILPGAEVTVVRAAPLGGPVELAQSDGQNIALRPREVEAVRCQPVAYPLSYPAVEPGDRMRVRRYLGKLGFRTKMRRRGLHKGAQFRILAVGPYRLQILPDGPEVLVGHGEAEKLLVEPLSD
jgi:ferrous iron transport protein A